MAVKIVLPGAVMTVQDGGRYGYQEAGKIQLIRSHGQLLKEEYRDDGIYVEAYIPKEILGSI